MFQYVFFAFEQCLLTCSGKCLAMFTKLHLRTRKLANVGKYSTGSHKTDPARPLTFLRDVASQICLSTFLSSLSFSILSDGGVNESVTLTEVLHFHQEATSRCQQPLQTPWIHPLRHTQSGVNKHTGTWFMMRLWENGRLNMTWRTTNAWAHMRTVDTPSRLYNTKPVVRPESFEDTWERVVGVTAVRKQERVSQHALNLILSVLQRVHPMKKTKNARPRRPIQERSRDQQKNLHEVGRWRRRCYQFLSNVKPLNWPA